MIAFIKELIRWNEWGDSKLPFIFIAWMLASINKYSIFGNLGPLLAVVLFSGCFLAFGYLYNDWLDREADKHAGKIKLVQNLPGWRVSLYLGVLVILSLIVLLPWFSNPIVIAVISLCYFCAITYSGPWFRFKERGSLGLLVSSISQRSLPAGLIFAILGEYNIAAAIYLCLTLIIGFRWMLIHQIDDYEKDSLSQIKTYTLKKGKDSSLKTSYLLFHLEIILLVILAFLLNYPPVWIIYLAYFLFTILISVATASTPWQMLTMPSSAYLVLSDFYFLYWPIGLAVLLSLQNFIFFFVLLILLFLLSRQITQHINALKHLLVISKAKIT